MLAAANFAGKAINITQTTAGHAMCYKLTKLYGISHGHAAALCVSVLWHFMIENTNLCIDSRGKDYLDGMLSNLAAEMGSQDSHSAADKFEKILCGLNLQTPKINNENDFDILTKSVNLVRLKNNPVKLDSQTIGGLYRQILTK
jgi:alcohol dehydrogenase class IV